MAQSPTYRSPPSCTYCGGVGVKRGGIYTPPVSCTGAAWQVEEMRRENETIQAAQRAETTGQKEGAKAEDEAQAELLVLTPP